jgi:hypothetical protein
MLGVDPLGSRRIEPAHVGCPSVQTAPEGSRRIQKDPEGSRRIQKDRLDDQPDDQRASDTKSDGRASKFYRWPLRSGSEPEASRSRWQVAWIAFSTVYDT